MFELRHLAALDAVATHGTFAAAAGALGYTQSSLSQQIATLERSVGGPLFDRPGGPRPARITPLGRLVLAEGRALLARDAAAREAVERFKAGEGRVDVGTFQTVTNVLLPGVVSRLRAEQPRCDIRLFEDETDDPRVEGLDLLFFDGPGPDEFDRVEVFRDEHVVVARRDQPDDPRLDGSRFDGTRFDDSVRLGDLDGLAMVALPPICDQARVEAAFSDADVSPRFVFRTADNQGVVAMVRAGLGVAVMPLLAIAGQRDDPDLVVLPIRPALPPRVVYVLSRGTLSPLATRFRDLAVEAGAAMTGAV